MNENIFKELKEEYDTLQLEYQMKISSYREQSVKQCLNKGYLIDVLTFEHELHGSKLHKKALNQMVMENECFIYHFNKEGRVCLVEEASTFLKKIENYTLYDYCGNYLYKYECQNDGMISVNKYFYENGKVVEGYTYAKFGHCYEQYVYNDEQLEKISYVHFEHQQELESRWESHFYYNKERKLKLIQQVYDNGYVVNSYADIKLSYKKLETQLYEACKEKIKLFLNQCSVEKIETIALRLWIDDLNPMLDINFRVLGDKEMSIAEWSYSSAATIEISDIPFDSTQQDKIVSVVYSVLVRLIDEGIIYSDIKVKVFHHDDKEIGLEKKAVQKLILGRQNFF